MQSLLMETTVPIVPPPAIDQKSRGVPHADMCRATCIDLPFSVRPLSYGTNTHTLKHLQLAGGYRTQSRRL